jgi:hypothetical protein
MKYLLFIALAMHLIALFSLNSCNQTKQNSVVEYCYPKFDSAMCTVYESYIIDKEANDKWIKILAVSNQVKNDIRLFAIKNNCIVDSLILCKGSKYLVYFMRLKKKDKLYIEFSLTSSGCTYASNQSIIQIENGKIVTSFYGNKENASYCLNPLGEKDSTSQKNGIDLKILDSLNVCVVSSKAYSKIYHRTKGIYIFDSSKYQTTYRFDLKTKSYFFKQIYIDKYLWIDGEKKHIKGHFPSLYNKTFINRQWYDIVDSLLCPVTIGCY